MERTKFYLYKPTGKNKSMSIEFNGRPVVFRNIKTAQKMLVKNPTFKIGTIKYQGKLSGYYDYSKLPNFLK